MSAPLSLPPGTRIGPYEIASFLGAGGMGQVYKARDVRLDRTVALKILPPHIAADPGFRERFDREARAISGLDHVHICALYDVGSDEGTDFLVMQFLDGETLAARLERGALSLNEALRYGSEIADALAVAHRAGIVHRDLKPANVMLTKGGVKLLDFGVAKVTQSDPSARGTQTSLLTGQGVLLGTLQYMAPEQLEGKEADARCDIWALGAVIYEMLTGQAAFSGTSQASVIGKILHSVPEPVSTSQILTPPAVDRVVAKCLNKDPDERWQSAHDVADELRWISKGTGGQIAGSVHVPSSTSGTGRLKKAVAAALVLALASIGFAAWTWLRTRSPSGTSYRLGLPLPDGVHIEDGIALSPDGRWLAFVGAQDSQQVSVLWIRSMDSFDARPIAGTEGAQFPFWSPDNRHVAFFAKNKLQRVAVAGGAPQILSDVSSARGGSWSRDDIIVFAPTFMSGLWRVSASGGEARPLTTLKEPEGSHRWPHFLPDGRHYLYLVRGGPDGGPSTGLFLGSLDGGDPSKLLSVDSSAVFAPSGHLLFVQGGMLLAQPFSASQQRLTGEAFMVSDKVLRVGDAGPTALGVYSVAAGGLLVYSANESVLNELSWFDRTGKRLSTVSVPADYSEMWLSPAQTEVVVYRSGDLWIVNFQRGTSSRFSFEAGEDVSPVWSPDGKWIVYHSGKDDGITARLATGGGRTHPLLKVPETELFPDDWSRDGHILFERVDRKHQTDIWAMSAPVLGADGTLALPGKPFPVLDSPFSEAHAQFSPDGKWIAYGSDESGRAEVYVQSYPPGQGKWLVSTDGGDQPTWRRDGRELYYISADKRLVAVDVRVTPTFQIGASTVLFRTTVASTGLGDARNNYLASADGQRFLVSSVPTQSRSVPLRVVLNWHEQSAR